MWKSKGIKWVIVGLVILAILIGTGCAIINKPPEITSLTPSATSLAPGGSCTINCAASDPDGDTLTYGWTVSGGAISGEGDTVTWTAPTTEETYTITATVSDGKGRTASDSCDITAQVVNTPPEVTSLTPSTTSLAPGDSCTINCAASDPDGDTLTYEWTATGGAISGEGDTVTWTAPTTEETYTITVTVSDGKGGTASDDCDITAEVKFGSIDINSSPPGAAVYFDEADTGNITPYILTNVDLGSHTIKLDLPHYEYREETVTVTADETTYINWSLTPAPEQTVTIQPNAAAGKDAGVDIYYPGQNYANHYEIGAGRGSVDTCRGYLEFDLSSIPDDVVVINAKVGLYYYHSVDSAAATIGVYIVEEAWTEGGITWNNQPDSEATPEDAINVPAFSAKAFRYWYIDDLVKDWLDGAISNKGIMLKDTDESTIKAWKGFYSSDWGTASQRPKLVITYYDPNP